MRTLTVLVWRALVGLSIFAAGWAPAALLTVWGGAYFLRCVNTLTAPGVPIEYRYESEAGTMLVSASGYQIDPSTMEGFFTGVSVSGPRGQTVAKCGVADFSIQGGVFVLRMSNPEFTVNRLDDGSFDVQHMLPAKLEDKASDSAFRLAVRGGAVSYFDPSVSKEPLAMKLDRLVVDGWGGSFAFRSEISAGKLDGSVHGSMTKSDGLVATLDVNDSEVAGLLPYVNSFLDEETAGEFAHVSAKRFVIDGSMTLVSKEDAQVNIHGDATMSASGLRSPQTFRSADFTATVQADGSKARVDARLSQKGLDAKFDGVVQTQGSFRLVGALGADIATRTTLPPQVKPFVPKDALFENAVYKGTIDTDGKKFLLDGSVHIKQVTYAGETTTKMSGATRLSERGLFAQIDEATWAGIDYTGAVRVDFESGKVSGGIQSRRGRLEPLAQRFGTDRLSGIVSASAVLGGTVDELYADVYARGSGGVKIGDGPITSLGVYEVRGRLDGKGVRLDRLEVNGANGLVVASGFMDWETGGLSFDAKGGGLDVASAVPEAKGFGFIDVKVGGTKDAPTFAGRAEVYALEAFDRKIPQAVADFRTAGRTVDFERFAIRAGTGQIEGAVKLDLDNRVLDGGYSGKGIRLEEWLVEEVVGSADVLDGKIFGTLSQPSASGTVKAQQFFAYGINVSGATVPYVVEKEKAITEGFALHVKEGTIQGFAEFLFAQGDASVKGTFEKLPLENVSLPTNALSFDGLITGNFDATRKDKAWTARASSDLTGIAVNKTLVGQGWLEFAMKGDTLSLDGQVGSIERYILADRVTYDLQSKEIQGDALVYNVLLEDVLAAARSNLDGFPERVKNVASNVSGLLNADVSVSGQASDPNLEIKALSATELKLRGREAGEVRVGVNRRAGVWDITCFEWEQGDTKFSSAGTITENGDFALNGELNNFDASWIHTWMPEVPLFTGGLDLSFQSSGTFDDPRGRATLVAHDLGYFDGTNAVKVPLSVELDEISVSQRAVALHGQMSYQGLSAEVAGTVPFAGLYGETDLREVMVTATVDERPLADLSPFFLSIDKDRSVGTVNGLFGLRGGWDTLEMFADMRTHGTNLAFNGQSTTLSEFDFSASLNKDGASLKGAFTGGQGGRGTLEARTILPEGLVRGEVDKGALMSSAVTGKIALDRFRLKATLPTAEKESVATVTTEDFVIAGTIGSPRITGDLLFEGLYVRLPEELEESKAPTLYEIDPIFEGITITAAEGSLMDSGNARIDFFGKGRLGGSLQNPDISLPLKVSGGVLELPTARIDLESNGDIAIGYRALLGSAPTARIDLRLEGNTTVSARRVDSQYETYPVQLDIRGNLLEENGLTIFAVSDPPDLSSDQIMAILGRKELIEEFARRGSTASVRESIYSAALPAAANMVTSGIADELGLDYISLDYNPLDQAIAGFGKSVGRGLMVHANRQLSSSAGEQLKYEVQLTYRLPMRDRIFSRVRLGFGADQDVPWRLRLNWSRRF